jgi:hypothetical protein
MTEKTERLNEGGTADQQDPISPVFVDNLDEIVLEIREYIANAALQNPKQLENRKDCLLEVSAILQGFIRSLNAHIHGSGGDVELCGLADRLLKRSPCGVVDASLAVVASAEAERLLADHLNQLPYPHYEATPGDASTIVQIQADGSRTIGRFVDREFIANDNG